MSGLIAALPMYDWPEVRAETDAQWACLRDGLRRRGVDAPQALTRHNRAGGQLDLAALWRHPGLLFAQTCWGPMEFGLADHVQVIGQPDYSAFEGGRGELYSSAVVMRREEAGSAPSGASASLSVELLRSRRFAFNSRESMSGFLALVRDIEAMGEGLGIFSGKLETGGHRASLRAIAESRADLASIDCRSWAMARRFEPAARNLVVVGWTAGRKGLPYICAKELPPETVAALREAGTEAGMLVAD